MIDKTTVITDNDRSVASLLTNRGSEWRLVSDQVMGGRSTGQLDTAEYRGRQCLRLEGIVSTANNGGFLQMALDLNNGESFDASSFTGVALYVTGNKESYNVHLRSSGLWLPWQSYRASFIADATWQEIRIPFSEFEAYRTSKKFRPDRLERIGIVAIGRNFNADICLADVSFYRSMESARK